MAELESSDLLDIFLLEAEDCITILDKGIYELETSSENPQTIEDIFRAAHTLKGAASIVKLDTISKIAHVLENILEDLKLGKTSFTAEIKEVSFYILDTIKDLTHSIAAGNKENYELGKLALEKIDALLSKEQTQGYLQETAQTAYRSSETIEPEIVEKRETFGRRAEDMEFFTGNFVKVNLQKVEKILDIMGELVIMKNLLSHNTSDTQKVSDEIGFIGNRLLREIDNFSEKYAYSLPVNVKYIDPLLSEFGELEFDRYDELNLFSRKLHEIMNDLTEALKELSVYFDAFSSSVKTTGKLLNLLRADISEMRMIEIGRLFHCFVSPVQRACPFELLK
ncbi:MAG: Hpt domain-containing protein [Thermodesulfovibrionales bacterium]|nr:Hpt domain-containing protein [Thermodesulfovibrionales bacterium]